MEPRINTDKHGFLRAIAEGPFAPRVARVLRAFLLFLRGALGLAADGSHGSYVANLEHKYSRPTRCC